MRNYEYLRRRAILGLLPLSILYGCDNHISQKNALTDKTAFKNIIELDISTGSVNWEKFSWPEKSKNELLETNLDYVILIAEITPGDKPFFDSLSSGGVAYVVPGAARPWLSRKSQIMLENHGSTSMDLSIKSNCRPLVTKLKKTNQPARGFMCDTGEKALVYLVLASYT